MTNSAQHRSWTLNLSFQAGNCGAGDSSSTCANGGRGTIGTGPDLHRTPQLTSGQDGESPLVGLTIDAAGNLYGTASEGGFGKNGACYPNGCGTVFKLRHTNSGWLLTPIYDFQGHSKQGLSYGGVTIGRDGTLYGTTDIGGSSLAALSST